jgi:hypothetical protein
MWTASFSQEMPRMFLIGSLRSYVRPVDAVVESRWPRWFPRREFQTGMAVFFRWVPRSVSRLGSIDRTICFVSCKVRPRRAFAGRAERVTPLPRPERGYNARR